MRRRLFGKRILAFALSAVLLASSAVPVWADEEYEEYDYEETSDYQEDYDDWDYEEAIPEIEDRDSNNDGEADDIAPVVNDDQGTYSLTLDVKKLSFGTATVGYPIKPQTVTIRNTGNVAVHLIWKDVDPDCAFSVDATKAQVINPGESGHVLVSVATNKGAGSYSGVLLFADASDTAYTSGVKLETSVTLKEEAAKINRLTISPAETSAAPGGSVNFSTQVEGEGDFDSSVSYKVSGNKSTDTVIDSDGHLRIGQNETASTITVKVTSNGDSSKSKEARVSIRKDSFNVNVYASPRSGGDVIGGGAYAEGSTVTVKAYSANGYYFNGWNVNGSRMNAGTTLTLENINKNYDITALFERDCVRIKAEPNHKSMGSVDGDGYANIGDTVVLKATAKKGFRFSCWMEGKKKISSDSKLKLKNVDEDRDLTAVFVKNECVVSVASCDTTMGTVSGGKTVEYGKSVTIKAKANKGYKFVKWVCNDQEIGKSAEMKLPDLKDDITVVAIFEKDGGTAPKVYTMVSGTTDGNGVISPSGTILMEAGKSINYTITPKSGYKIAAIAIDGKQVAVTSSLTFSKIAGDHTIVAAFLPVSGQASASTQNVKDSHKTAAGSDINAAVDATPEKKYEENIVNEKVDTSKFVGDEEDSMDNGLDSEEGVLQDVNTSSEEALSRMGDDAYKYELVRQAVYSEALQVNLDNSMRRNKFVMSYDEDALENPETVNFAKILCDVFDDDEVMKLVSGEEKVSVDIAITPALEDHIPLGELSKLKESVPEGKQVGQYFFSSFVKNVDGEVTEIDEFGTPLMVTVDIPDNLVKSGREYSVARLHTYEDGTQEVTILSDEDNDPKTITFETDRFSTYAILCDSDLNADTNRVLARPTVARKAPIDWVVVGSIVFIFFASVALIFLIIGMMMKGNRRRRRR